MAVRRFFMRNTEGALLRFMYVVKNNYCTVFLL